MPDFNDQFSRFMDQFQRDSKADSRTNEEVATTLRELLDEQRKMRENAEALARQAAIDAREAEMELERERKRNKVVDDKAEKSGKESSSKLEGLLGSFKSLLFNPGVLAAAVGLAVADSMTKINLRETLFAGTIISKMGSANLLKGMTKISTATPRALSAMGKSLQAKGGMTAKGGKAGFKLGGGMEYIGKGAKGADKLGRVKVTGGMKAARVAGGAMRGAGAVGTGVSKGIFGTISALLKPFMSLLKPVMSVVKLFAKASVVLTPIIMIIEGAMKAFEVFQGGGSIAEVIMGFLIGALESITTGIIEGLTTLGGWLLAFVESLPDIIMELIDGVLDFISMLFGGEEDSMIGGMLMDFAMGLWDALKGLLGVVIKLAMRLLVLPWVMLGKLIGLILPGIGNAIADFFSGIADWVGDLWDWFWSDDEEWEQMKKDKENARKKKELEDAKKLAEAQGDTTEMDKINAELATLSGEAADDKLQNAKDMSAQEKKWAEEEKKERKRLANSVAVGVISQRQAEEQWNDFKMRQVFEKGKVQMANAEAKAQETGNEQALNKIWNEQEKMERKRLRHEIVAGRIDEEQANKEWNDWKRQHDEKARSTLTRTREAEQVSLDAQADDAEDRQEKIVGKLKGLKDITMSLMKTYGGAVKSFMDDPAAGFAGVNQASARGQKRTYGGFDWAQQLDPFGGERTMFEATPEAQNVGTNVLHDSMATEMAERGKSAASAVGVNAPTTNNTYTANQKTHSQVPRGTRHTDRSLDKANRRDNLI